MCTTYKNKMLKRRTSLEDSPYGFLFPENDSVVERSERAAVHRSMYSVPCRCQSHAGGSGVPPDSLNVDALRVHPNISLGWFGHAERPRETGQAEAAFVKINDIILEKVITGLMITWNGTGRRSLSSTSCGQQRL